MDGDLNKNKEENNMDTVDIGEKMDEEKKKNELEQLRGKRKKAQPTKTKRPKNPKFFKWTLIIMAVLVLFGVVLNLYERWSGERDVEELKVGLEEWEKAIFEEKNNDTVGGATPQETLNMFISAVERGDYELASSYFIVGKQEEELESLRTSKKENIDNVISALKKARNSEGAFLSDDNYFVENPIFISFIKYPKGNWKIEEI